MITEQNLVENPDQSASCLMSVLSSMSDQHFFPHFFVFKWGLIWYGCAKESHEANIQLLFFTQDPDHTKCRKCYKSHHSEYCSKYYASATFNLMFKANIKE